MKKILKRICAVLLIASMFIPQQAGAQSPTKMSYQAVIRNSSGSLVCNTQIGMEINIRQGTPSGTIIYTETQTPFTNENGLVNIEIGGGIGFTLVNWINGPFYLEIKTATSAPLTAYTITGTSQLLSVPFALHAKTAEIITGSINETDPLFTAWDKDYADLINKPIEATASMSGLMSAADKTKLDGLQNADGSETKISAGTNISITGNGSIANPYVVNASSSSSPARYVGELYGGGVVFWVDNTGLHGLVVSMIDLTTNQAWSNVTATVLGTTNDWDGASNTTAITTQNGHTASAAKICADYSNADYGTGVYTDWYLPSIAELNIIWNNFYAIQKTLTTDGNPSTLPLSRLQYWSSSEYSSSAAWMFRFSFGDADYFSKSTTNMSVRAVRSF